MAATVAGLLHELWAAHTTLEGLLPAERVFTGRVPIRTPMPYASITQPAGMASGQSNLHRYGQETWRVQVWCERYAEGEAIQRAVEDCFLNYNGPLDTGGVLCIGHDSSFSLQEEEPGRTVWQFVIQFSISIERPRADG